jgi:hypothetical protein
VPCVTTYSCQHLGSPLRPAAEVPPPGPVDEFTALRLRRSVLAFFGDVPAIERHLALLDARGAWYATRAMGAWNPQQPGAFFGLVRHVVRTQFPGPAPDPDVEGWVAAGRPADTDVAAAWDLIRDRRYSLPASDPAPARPPGVGAEGVLRMDQIVTDWPAEHFDAFVFSYAAIEQVLERRARTHPLPPIDR